VHTASNFGYLIFNDPNYFSYGKDDVLNFEPNPTWTKNEIAELKLATTEKR